MKLPRFYRWGGGEVKHTWSFGWLIGRDNDLVCVMPEIETEQNGELTLSPVCSTRILALLAFISKFFLVRIDYNVRIRMSDYDNPSKESHN